LGNLLSAASLLLAILAVFYGLWYPEIAEALELKLPLHKEDATEELKRIRRAAERMALPLTVAAIAVALVFLPDSVGVLIDSVAYVASNGASLSNYDAVSASLVLVTVLNSFLAGHMARLTYRLFKRLHLSYPSKK